MADVTRKNKKTNQRIDQSTDQYFSKRPQTKEILKGARISKSRKPTVKKTARAPRVMKGGRRQAPLIGSRRTTTLFLAAGLVIALAFTLWFFLHKNAYEVYVGDDLQGVIAMSKSMTQDNMYDLAVAKLAAEVGANVKVDKKITFKAVRAPQKNLSRPEHIISNIYKTWPYSVEASIITLNGVELTALISDEEAETVLARIAEHYVEEGAVIVNKTFEGVEIIKKYVKPDEILSPDTAYTKLNISSESPQDYTVNSGENLWTIASRAGMTLDEVLAINEGVTPESLKVGQVISLIVNKPLITVTTVEEYTYTDVAEKEIQTRENPNQYKTYSKMIQQGRDGQKEVTAHITRSNGFEVKKEIINEEIVVEPIPEIVEVGTNQTVTSRP